MNYGNKWFMFTVRLHEVDYVWYLMQNPLSVLSRHVFIVLVLN